VANEESLARGVVEPMADTLAIKSHCCGGRRGRKSHDRDVREGVAIHVFTLNADFNGAILSLEGDDLCSIGFNRNSVIKINTASTLVHSPINKGRQYLHTFRSRCHSHLEQSIATKELVEHLAWSWQAVELRGPHRLECRPVCDLAKVNDSTLKVVRTE